MEEGGNFTVVGKAAVVDAFECEGEDVEGCAGTAAEQFNHPPHLLLDLRIPRALDKFLEDLGELADDVDVAESGILLCHCLG